jgi:hypothetical protein
MTPAPPLTCCHCGRVALPVDPGWTLAEVAKMLRITKRYVLTLAQHHASDLDEPGYRPLRGNAHRMYRVWSSRDVQFLNTILTRSRVKNAQSGRFKYVRRTSANGQKVAIA